MKYPMKATILTILALAGWTTNARAMDGEADPQVQQIAAKIDQTEAQIAILQQQKEALERQRAMAEQLAEQRTELAGLLQESQDRMADAEAQLVELEKPTEATTKAQQALTEAKRQFLGSRKELDAKILAINDPAAIGQAKELRKKIDELETEWSLVLEPKFNAAVAIEDMEMQLLQVDDANKQKILRQLKQLADQDAVGRRQEFAAIKARNERETAWARLIEAFDKAE